MIASLDITVRSTDIDMLGHVNNAKYQEYLEWGRFEWLRHCGMPRDEWVARKLSAVVVNVNINYRAEARMDDRLRIDTALVHLGKSSTRYAQRVVHVSDNRLACDASVTGVLFDLQKRQSTPIPDEIRALLETTISVDPWGADRPAT